MNHRAAILCCRAILAIAALLAPARTVHATGANDHPSGATVLSLFGMGVGTLNHIDDPVDWWVVQVSALGSIRFTLDVPPGQDFDLEIHDTRAPNGRLAGSYRGAGQRETATAVMTYSGPYYARVYTYGQSSGTYTLRCTIVTSTNADLAVQQVAAAARVVAPGDNLVVSNVIRNTGARTAEAYRVDFFLSTDSIISPSDRSLGYALRAPLPPDGAHRYNSTVSIPADMPFGAYYLGLIATCGNDADASNNSGRDPHPVTVARAVSDFGGVVSDALSGGPLAGAVVEWGSLVRTTGVNGVYSFVSAPCETRTLRVRRAGYIDYAQPYQPVCLASSQKNVALTPNSTEFGGVVSNALTGERIAGATVAWGTLSTTTDAQGVYRFSGVPCEARTLRIEMSGYEIYARSYAPVCRASSARDVGLQPALSEFGGRVTDAMTANPIPGAHVTWGGYAATTDVQGVYRLRNVPCSSHTLSVSRPGYETAQTTFAPACYASSVKHLSLIPNQAPKIANARAAQRMGTGLIDVYYDLNTYGRLSEITVELSTNGGLSYDVAASNFTGTGVGIGVRAGNHRHFVWDADADLPNFVSDQARLRISVDWSNGLHSATTPTFAIDTRTGDRPIVEDVVSAHGDQFRHVYYLAGVPAEIAFTALVNWNGRPPGTIRFSSPLGAVEGAERTHSLNVGRFAVGDSLFVTAISSDGTASTPYRANFDVIPRPLQLPAMMFAFEPQGDSMRYVVNSFVIRLIEAGIDAIPTDENGNVIPGFGGRAFKTVTDVAMKLAVHGDGTAWGCETTLWSNEFKVAGFDVTPSLSGGFRLRYRPDTLDWMPSGEILFRAAARFGTPPAYIWASPPVYLRGDIDLAAGAELAVIDWADGAPVLRGGLPVEAAASFVAGCGASGVAAVEGYVGGGGGARGDVAAISSAADARRTRSRPAGRRARGLPAVELGARSAPLSMVPLRRLAGTAAGADGRRADEGAGRLGFLAAFTRLSKADPLRALRRAAIASAVTFRARRGGQRLSLRGAGRGGAGDEPRHRLAARQHGPLGGKSHGNCVGAPRRRRVDGATVHRGRRHGGFRAHYGLRPRRFLARRLAEHIGDFDKRRPPRGGLRRSGHRRCAARRGNGCLDELAAGRPCAFGAQPPAARGRRRQRPRDVGGKPLEYPPRRVICTECGPEPRLAKWCMGDREPRGAGDRLFAVVRRSLRRPPSCRAVQCGRG
jgi:hypothetical protein